MNLFVTILLAILIFGVIIIIHELGHFLTAKAVGIAVPEFSIGMGPKLLQWEKGETKYTLRLLPIGGYVAMEGEDEESDNERAFCNKKPLQKILVVAAGATMNLILGFLIMLAIVCSTVSWIRPSPARKPRPCIAISWPRIAASTAAEILAAQLALAPSHTMPPTLPSVFETVAPICSRVPSHSQVIAAPAPHAAQIAPQNAESAPI